jgi:predicted transcriptional regulator
LHNSRGAIILPNFILTRMNIICIKDNLDRIDQLIRLNATGTPKELALKLEITERTVYRIIRQLKEIGFPIYFNKAIRSYCYKYEGKLIFSFESKCVDSEVINEIKNGGGVKPH